MTLKVGLAPILATPSKVAKKWRNIPLTQNLSYKKKRATQYLRNELKLENGAL